MLLLAPTPGTRRKHTKLCTPVKQESNCSFLQLLPQPLKLLATANSANVAAGGAPQARHAPPVQRADAHSPLRRSALAAQPAAAALHTPSLLAQGGQHGGTFKVHSTMF